MSDFSALHVALSGLRAAQTGIDLTSHNVANAATPGYTRQRVDLVPRLPRISPEGLIGTGVDVADISRLRDAFLDARIRAGSSVLGGLSIRSDFLARAEAVLGEPEQGITAELTELWNAFEDLALNPPDPAARMLVLDRLDSLSGRISGVAQDWAGLGATATRALQALVDEANQILFDVGEINQAILEASALGGTPNDLMDRRDAMVDRLSQLIGATASDQGDGTFRVSLNGMALVSGNLVRPLALDPGNLQLLHPSGVAVTAGGEAAGYQKFVLGDLPAHQAKLDQLAVDLTGVVNAVHAGGYWSSTDQGGDLLTFDPTSPALTLRRAISDPAQLATASSPGPPFPIWDGTLAQQLADARTQVVGPSGTIGDALRVLITGLGQEVASTRASAETQTGLMASADRARRSAHEVSIDEELVNLMAFQRMYEAAARVITTVDEALDVLINRTGIVGR